ncbi:hypothetical protein AAMO2058_001233200 [Amorphochlora amoebiformis]|eukprot:1334925-Amorphochlora_amoeboformis.AAC.2
MPFSSADSPVSNSSASSQSDWPEPHDVKLHELRRVLLPMCFETPPIPLGNIDESISERPVLPVPVLHMVEEPPSDDSEESSRLCPCCRKSVKDEGLDFHRHLISCLFTAKGQETLLRENIQDGSVKTSQKIEKFRSFVTMIDLRERISIMESLYRLSREARPPSDSPVPDPAPILRMSTMTLESDKKVLSLLYGVRKRHLITPPTGRGRSPKRART